MKDDIMNKDFWIATLVRAIKTFAQAMVAQIGAGSIGILSFDWATALSVSAMAFVLSVFTSIAAGLPEVRYQQSLEQLADLRPDTVTDEDEEEEGDEDGDADEE